MSRVAAAINCTAEDRAELERLSKSRTDEARRVERAKIVLGCLSGRRNDEMAAELGIQAATVGTWRKRFASEGLAGLNDRARSGKPPVHPAPELRRRILKQLEAPPPVGLSGWDGGTLAQALGVSDDAVWRVLRKVATGEIKSKTTHTKKRPDFQAFMEDLVVDIPDDRQIHVILDNYCTHKKNHDWLARHPNVHFHFTPTSASWLNQVEIWFGIFARKPLSGASFASIEQLVQAIEAFIASCNQSASPFVWRKREVKGSQLGNTIVNLCN